MLLRLFVFTSANKRQVNEGQNRLSSATCCVDFIALGREIIDGSKDKKLNIGSFKISIIPTA